MFTFLNHRRRGRNAISKAAYSPFGDSPETSRNRAVGQSLAEEDEDEEDYDEEEEGPSVSRPMIQRTSYFDGAAAEDYDDGEDEESEGEDGDGDGDEDEVNTPLLPIFSAAHLDRLPLYNITHTIRLLIVQKCETTLSWDQLRSPQISQFLVKPIQNQIRTNHFNRATLCALIANCLQFGKEGQLHPGNVGVSNTRALISELLAMRLVKEFSTRELIDALSYDFDPLQGITPATPAPAANQRASGWSLPAQQLDLQGRRTQAKGARVSTIEIAIRAQAKRFLAHPLVVQHLEAIWAGTIVFHSEADNLHRKPSSKKQPRSRSRGRTYGTLGEQHSPSALPADAVLSRKARSSRPAKHASVDRPFTRRSVTLYDPRDASLFKLSRLRVPRYRQIFSTLSFATMLGLFIAVLYQRRLDITALEVLFWFWSAAYMLDEVVGFSEQGFGLYILSFWNAFDLGILLLFVVYYCLRLYGLVLADENKHRIAYNAYDFLAATAILLFPRLFSVLDHYRYFSQLLIAFRMMAQDLVAVLVLILISCSGFFVAFTLSFADDDTDGNAVAYELFQILMGFTPAAWDKWAGYNALGKAIMTAFLIICHFLIVTILITVLTNSFMAIVRNANEEHQYLFAINTISMVKSDALFSYVAPTNILGWVLSPLRYIIPFRSYVKFNRTVIKITHFPLLFLIFSYERLVLSSLTYEPTDMVDKRQIVQPTPLALSISKAKDVFKPERLLREPSVMSFHKDRALDEVFRRPFKGSTVRTTTRDMEQDRNNTTTAVDQWMQTAENEGGASPPLEQPRSVLERLEHHRPGWQRASTADRLRMARRGRDISMTRSLGSEPDIMSTVASRRPFRIDEEVEDRAARNDTAPQETDADGDDEENNDDSETGDRGIDASSLVSPEKQIRSPSEEDPRRGFLQIPARKSSGTLQPSASPKTRLPNLASSLHRSSVAPDSMPQPHSRGHGRTISTGTAVWNPNQNVENPASALPPFRPSRPFPIKAATSGFASPTGPSTAKPKAIRPRPIMPPRQRTAPGPAANLGGLNFLDLVRQEPRKPSFNARALDLASDIGDNKWGPSGDIDAGGISGMPNSFSEQLMREKELERQREDARRRSEEEEKGMVNRILLARMHTLEEGFREVLKEVKDFSRSNANSSRRDSEAETGHIMSAFRRREAAGGGSKFDSATASGSATGAQTPARKLSQGDPAARLRKSPRKLQRGGKARDPERPFSAAGLRDLEREREAQTPSPKTVPEAGEAVEAREEGTTNANAGAVAVPGPEEQREE